MKKLLFTIIMIIVNCVLGVCKLTEWLLANRVVIEKKIGS